MSLDFTQIIVSLITAGSTVGGIYLTNLFKSSKTEDKVTNHLSKKKQMLDLLSNAQTLLNADRLNVWFFSNGTQYYTGGHLQNLSCFAEVNNIGFESLETSFQQVPIQFFERNLFKLTTNDVIVSDERNEQDDLGIIHRNFGVKFIICSKIKSGNKWVGVLCASYSTLPTDLDAIKSHLKLLSTQLSR